MKSNELLRGTSLTVYDSRYEHWANSGFVSIHCKRVQTTEEAVTGQGIPWQRDTALCQKDMMVITQHDKMTKENGRDMMQHNNEMYCYHFQHSVLDQVNNSNLSTTSNTRIIVLSSLLQGYSCLLV